MTLYNKTKDGLTVRLEQDTNADSPRDWDNLGTIVCFHGRYDLGDKHELSLEEARELEDSDSVLSLPLYLYDHSGLRIKVGSFQGLLPQGHAEFDSGKVGFIYVSLDRVREEYGDDGPESREKALACLRSEVETYDQYLSGDVYGYVVEDADGEHVDSCWGFFGYEYAEQEANDALDQCLAGRADCIEEGEQQ